MAVITVQCAPRSCKRVAMLGEWRNRCDRKALDRLMSFPSRAAGVGQPVEALSFVIGSDGISTKNTRRNGVTFALKVQADFIEPPPSNRAFNLFAKDCCRATLADEGEERRPQMALIALAFRAAMTNRSDGVGLAWA